jgi:5-formyltetrahydrofolate cyclo-ligase
MLKKDLRLKYSRLRKDLTAQSLLNSSLTIANKILELPIWGGEFYHIFLAIAEKKEIDTSFLLSVLHGKDKNIVLPKVSSANELKHYLLTDTTKLVASKWGIPEPIAGIEILEEKIDVVFVPLLAFDQKGNRLGYGKGYYDNFLGKCKTSVIKVGLSLFEAEEEISDINENDIPLDYCVTPNRTYSFSNT